MITKCCLLNSLGGYVGEVYALFICDTIKLNEFQVIDKHKAY